MTGETPEADLILARLARVPKDSRGLTAAGVATSLRARGRARVTDAGIRRHLVQMQAAGLVRGRHWPCCASLHWVAIPGV